MRSSFFIIVVSSKENQFDFLRKDREYDAFNLLIVSTTEIWCTLVNLNKFSPLTINCVALLALGVI